jgi:predicted dehydrogenase
MARGAGRRHVGRSSWDRGRRVIAHRHAGVLAGFDDVEVRAVAGPVLEQAEELAAHVGAAAYLSHPDMLDAEALDAVYGGRPRSC